MCNHQSRWHDILYTTLTLFRLCIFSLLDPVVSYFYIYQTSYPFYEIKILPISVKLRFTGVDSQFFLLDFTRLKVLYYVY